MSTTYTGNFKAPIFIKKSDYDALATKDTFQEYVFTDIRALEIQTGTSDPTTSTSDEQGNIYQNTTTGDMFFLRSITGSTTYNWVPIITGALLNGTAATVTNGNIVIPAGTNSAIGLAKGNSAYGTLLNSGEIRISKSEESDLIAKTSNFKPVVAGTLDIAVREGLGNNALTWTDAYKTSARNTLGCIGLEEYDSTAASYDETKLYYVPETVQTE